MTRGTMFVVVLTAAGAAAQTDTRPQFEVATIRPAAPDARGAYLRGAPGGRINVRNMTLKELITMAWRIQPFQVSGGPAWLDSARFDIEAKPEKPPGQYDIPLMMQRLLEDRFALKMRHETKEMAVYALVMAKKDGTAGPQLKETAEGGCTVFDSTKPPAPPKPAEPAPRVCGSMMMRPPGNLTGIGIPVPNVLPMLARLLGRSVIDKTGLTGKYDLTLDFAPDETIQMMPSPGGPPNAPPPPSNPSGPSLFSALQDQLGLKLESQRGPVEIFVIERAEKPGEN